MRMSYNNVVDNILELPYQCACGKAVGLPEQCDKILWDLLAESSR